MNQKQKSPSRGEGGDGEDLPYYSQARYLKDRFGQKVYRLSLDAGLGCPNRTSGLGGCAYCSARGSWRAKSLPLREQVAAEMERVRTRYGAEKYVVYFQSNTNTYADPVTLARLYDAALDAGSDIVGLFIGTRPDCVDREKLALIASYRARGLDVWIEYGLQSAWDDTLRLIGRGHDAARFKDAVLMTAEYGIRIMAHVILGLPGEGRTHFRETARFLAGLPVDGVKVHNLNVLRGTPMEEWYGEGKVHAMSLDEYADSLVDFLERIRPDMVVGRVAADAPADALIAPRWVLDKNRALGVIRSRFAERGTRQGALFSGGTPDSPSEMSRRRAE
jgi:radical SAM protein (TIGR01212 family)